MRIWEEEKRRGKEEERSRKEDNRRKEKLKSRTKEAKRTGEKEKKENKSGEEKKKRGEETRRDSSSVGKILTPLKLDGVGPVDNRPSTDYLDHFVRKIREKNIMWQLKRDTWQVACDMWHIWREKKKSLISPAHLSPVTCHLSPVTCHLSPVITRTATATDPPFCNTSTMHFSWTKNTFQSIGPLGRCFL